MNILIAVASRHGSTLEIAEAIGQELYSAGHLVDVRRADAILDPTKYDAVVIGSAIYMGGWLPAARQFVECTHARLAEVPVWLFSSGPLGAEAPQPTGDPTHLDELLQATGALEHRIFVGKLDKHQLGVAERLAARLVQAPEGDFREWAAIRGWAHTIASTLAATLPATT
jgi:menaquinone-dependent protoporphyrinogen oxidase